MTKTRLIRFELGTTTEGGSSTKLDATNWERINEKIEQFEEDGWSVTQVLTTACSVARSVNKSTLSATATDAVVLVIQKESSPGTV